MPSLFLALFPPQEMATRIAADAAGWTEFAGNTPRTIAPERLHITLAYLGDRGDDEHCTGAARRALEQINSVPVDTEFSMLRAFGDAGVRPVVLTGEHVNPYVSELRELLLPELDRAGVAVDASHEFVPHITVAYADGDFLPATVGPHRFRCSEIRLIRGGDYAVLARRALIAPPDGPFTRFFRDPSAPGGELTQAELEERRSLFSR